MRARRRACLTTSLLPSLLLFFSSRLPRTFLVLRLCACAGARGSARAHIMMSFPAPQPLLSNACVFALLCVMCRVPVVAPSRMLRLTTRCPCVILFPLSFSFSVSRVFVRVCACVCASAARALCLRSSHCVFTVSLLYTCRHARCAILSRSVRRVAHPNFFICYRPHLAWARVLLAGGGWV